jgi:hypothetical protein
MWIHAHVFSHRLKQWRKQQPYLDASHDVAGGQIGNLQTDHAWLEWELADPNNRDSVLDDAVSTIENLAFPYFAHFDDLASLTSRLLVEDLPSMPIDCVIEFLMCFSDHQTARRSAANFLQRRPDLLQSYHREFQKYVTCGIVAARPSGYAQELAFASHAFEFGDLTEKEA